MHAALYDDARLDLAGVARERQAVADKIGVAVVDLWGLIVVRQDDGAAFALELVDGPYIRGEERPLDRRHHVLDARIKLRGVARDLVVPFQGWCLQHGKFARGGGAAGGGDRGCGAGSDRVDDRHGRLPYVPSEHIMLIMSISRYQNNRPSGAGTCVSYEALSSLRANPM